MRKRFGTTALAVSLAAMMALGGCAPKETAVETTAVQTTEAQAAEAETTEAAETESENVEVIGGADGPTSIFLAGKTYEDAAEYLKVWFDVELSEEPTAEEFTKALQAVAGEDAPAIEGDLTWKTVVEAAVKAADYEELALSYPEEKVKERLEFYGAEGDANVACALDVSLIDTEEAKKAAAAEAITGEEAEQLLMRIADLNGDGRNYLGMVSDSDIFGKVDQAWNSFVLFDDPELSEVGKEAVLQGISTGYNLKSDVYSARFLPDLTLQYSHSDIKHAHQLLGLMRSEGLDAKVQLEPKISIYQYLLDWGPIPESTPTYEVKQFDDLYLVYAVEYDMMLEFHSAEDMRRFDDVIKAYAKKNEGNEEAVGLIYESWWQPLYSTTRKDMPAEDYEQIYDCVVKHGVYSIHPFTIPEKKDTVLEQLKALAGDLEIEAEERYCNTAFYNYLTGEDYQ